MLYSYNGWEISPTVEGGLYEEREKMSQSIANQCITYSGICIAGIGEF